MRSERDLDGIFSKKIKLRFIMSSTLSLNIALQNFVSNCNDTINNLQSAHATELCDASTSNNSWFGWGVSIMSNLQNHNAAHQVDNLQQQAFHINRMLDQSSLRGVIPLDTYFNGSGIRQAERAEHSFLPNLFLGSFYSSTASVGTASELSHTIRKIASVCDQAQCMQRMLHGRSTPMNYQEPFSRVYTSYNPYG